MTVLAANWPAINFFLNLGEVGLLVAIAGLTFLRGRRTRGVLARLVSRSQENDQQ